MQVYQAPVWMWVSFSLLFMTFPLMDAALATVVQPSSAAQRLSRTRHSSMEKALRLTALAALLYLLLFGCMTFLFTFAVGWPDSRHYIFAV